MLRLTGFMFRGDLLLFIQNICEFIGIHCDCFDSLWLFQFLVTLGCCICCCFLVRYFVLLLFTSINWYISRIFLSGTHTQISSVNLVSKLYITFNLICFSKLGVCTCTMCNNGFTVNDVKLVESWERDRESERKRLCACDLFSSVPWW